MVVIDNKQKLVFIWLIQKRKRKQSTEFFLQQYARKKSKNGFDPNDRCYNRTFEEKLKRMKPEEIQELIDDNDDDVSNP